MSDTKEIQRSFRIDRRLDAKLIAKAEKLDRPVSWVILRALEGALLTENEAKGRAVMRGARRRRALT